MDWLLWALSVPVVFIWIFITGKDAPMIEKIEGFIAGCIFGPASVLFIMMIWIGMLYDKINNNGNN